MLFPLTLLAGLGSLHGHASLGPYSVPTLFARAGQAASLHSSLQEQKRQTRAPWVDRRREARAHTAGTRRGLRPVGRKPDLRQGEAAARPLLGMAECPGRRGGSPDAWVVLQPRGQRASHPAFLALFSTKLFRVSNVLLQRFSKISFPIALPESQ